MGFHLSSHATPNISQCCWEVHRQNHMMIFGSDTSRLFHSFGSTIWISQSLSFLVLCFSLYWWAINMSSNGMIFMLPSKVQVTTEFWHDALSSTSDPLSNRLLISALEMILNVVVPVQIHFFYLFVRCYSQLISMNHWLFSRSIEISDMFPDHHESFQSTW